MLSWILCSFPTVGVSWVLAPVRLVPFATVSTKGNRFGRELSASRHVRLVYWFCYVSKYTCNGWWSVNWGISLTCPVRIIIICSQVSSNVLASMPTSCSLSVHTPLWVRNFSSKQLATLCPPIILVSSLRPLQRESRVGEGSSRKSQRLSRSLRKSAGVLLSGDVLILFTCDVIPSWSAIGIQ